MKVIKYEEPVLLNTALSQLSIDLTEHRIVVAATGRGPNSNLGRDHMEKAKKTFIEALNQYPAYEEKATLLENIIVGHKRFGGSSRGRQLACVFIVPLDCPYLGVEGNKSSKER